MTSLSGIDFRVGTTKIYTKSIDVKTHIIILVWNIIYCLIIRFKTFFVSVFKCFCGDRFRKPNIKLCGGDGIGVQKRYYCNNIISKLLYLQWSHWRQMSLTNFKMKKQIYFVTVIAVYLRFPLLLIVIIIIIYFTFKSIFPLKFFQFYLIQYTYY